MNTLLQRLRTLPGGPHVVTYGTGHADVQIVDVQETESYSRALVRFPELGEMVVRVPVPGRHMLLNGIAALTARSVVLDHDLGEAIAALRAFRGVHRRLTRRPLGDVTVIDSFAHHPREVGADLKAARLSTTPSGRVLVCFEPTGHLRLHEFISDLADALVDHTAQVIVLPTHSHHGQPVEASDGSHLADVITALGGWGRHTDDPETAARHLADAARPGDVLVTMGCGDVNRVGDHLTRFLDDRIPSA
ncbi:glutamate ligase domain-containing protein [Thermomonospora umbrina]|uniref:glutamate ligase domain-containing protein n=1 Tax=Thermomonospora umbrina TaxID=111806 RepID=UPI000E2207D8|nr:cyanophycin synthetase [Thermomonospora umbrina]